jgi:hypothetical protein
MGRWERVVVIRNLQWTGICLRTMSIPEGGEKRRRERGTAVHLPRTTERDGGGRVGDDRLRVCKEVCVCVSLAWTESESGGMLYVVLQSGDAPLDCSIDDLSPVG